MVIAGVGGGALQGEAALLQPGPRLLQFSHAQVTLQAHAELFSRGPLQGGDAHAEGARDVGQGHLVHPVIPEQHLQPCRLVVLAQAGGGGGLLEVGHQALPHAEGKGLAHQHFGGVLAAGEVERFRNLPQRWGQGPVEAAQMAAEGLCETLAMILCQVVGEPGVVQGEDDAAAAHLGFGRPLHDVGLGVEDGGRHYGVGLVEAAPLEPVSGAIGHQGPALEGNSDDQLGRQLSLGGEVGLVNDVLVVKAKTLLDHQVLHPAGEAAPLARAGIPCHCVSHVQFDHVEE